MTRSGALHPDGRPHEGRLILVMALIAAVRVFVFAAAFPPINHVDEDQHFDLVCKYALGQVPHQGLEHFGRESAQIIGEVRSTEYFPGGDTSTPRLRLPEPERSQKIAVVTDHWLGRINPETNSPPVYYAAAALWYRVGKAVGLRGGDLIYWVRFLNVPVFALMVWLAYQFCRLHLPDHDLIRVGVPWLLAFLPQDVYYGVNSDVLSAPLCLAAVLALCSWIRQDKHRLALAAATGLLTAAAFLTKYTNIVLVLTVAVALMRWSVVTRPRTPRRLLEVSMAAVTAALPVLVWFAWLRAGTGDPTGTGGKVDTLDWVLNSAGQVLSHPIFTPSGAWTFLSDLIKTCWRGELVWHGHLLNSRLADGFYIFSTLLFMTVGTLVFARSATSSSVSERAARLICIASPILSVLLLAALSVAFDFRNSFYPSREYPYFTSGRLISGSLVPVLALFVAGVERLSPASHRRIIGWSALGLVAAIQVVSEVILTAPVFQSPFNWFHLAR